MKVPQFLYKNSIWHPDAIQPEEFKFRNLKRLWLPLFDGLSILVGMLGVAYGSKILNELYPAALVDGLSLTFILAAFIALVGISFPKLWVPEVLGKLTMLGLLGGYSTAIWVSFFHGSVESGFVAAMLMYPVLFPLFRLDILGEEVKQRRVQGAGEVPSE